MSTVTSDDNGRKLQFTDKCLKIHRYLGPFAHRNSVNAHRNSRSVIILATLTPGEMRLTLNLTECGFVWVSHLGENEQSVAAHSPIFDFWTRNQKISV